ncbi:hypothetical protein [Demequina capsici]|uniref:Uncharacterized protein n=1 Tax=Demequina capsici TaxID=3075620 RepID=A0AA96J7J8_9MICO|nr:hypothetical protein [Demequina sp. OYTSA14]WNM24435.1 hypothetical protein RN606_13885 [Demequina sp. OYTSA14]
MSEGRDAFKDLHAVAGQVFDTTNLRANPDPVEARIARYRTGRTVLASFAGVAVVGAIAVGAMQRLGPAENAPATTPSSTPDATVTQAAVDPNCVPLTIVPGKAAPELGDAGLGWTDQDSLTCSRRSQEFLDHPDTVAINTVDDTMVEAYYRTSIDDLGVYADLGPDFVVPDPDPSWPENTVIMIDAHTREVLSVYVLPGYATPEPSLLGWVDWMTQRLTDPLQDAYAPAGFHVVTEGYGNTQVDDLVMPRTYGTDQYDQHLSDPSVDEGPWVDIRLAPLPDNYAAQQPLPDGMTLVDSDVYVTGSRVIDTGTGTFTVDIPVGDTAFLRVDGSDLDTIYMFIDAIITAEQG